MTRVDRGGGWFKVGDLSDLRSVPHPIEYECAWIDGVGVDVDSPWDYICWNFATPEEADTAAAFCVAAGGFAKVERYTSVTYRSPNLLPSLDVETNAPTPTPETQ